MTSTDFKTLWSMVAAQFYCGPDSIHGLSHWKRVEKNGLLLAEKTGANLTEVRLFAGFHDSCRVNAGSDAGDGRRGAILAKRWRGKAFEIPDELFNLLHDACVGHTDGQLQTDPTIGACWDADRLDLGRVGIIPDERFMSTAFGKELARDGKAHSLLI